MESLTGRGRTSGALTALTIAISAILLLPWTGFMRAVSILVFYVATVHNQSGVSLEARRVVAVGCALVWIAGCAALVLLVRSTVRAAVAGAWVDRLHVLRQRIGAEIAPVERDDAPMSRAAALVVVVVAVVVVGFVASR